MRPEFEEHTGVCPLCRANVPPRAIVCTGCGAVWGFEGGLNRPEVYDASKSNAKRFLILTIIASLGSILVFQIPSYEIAFGLGTGIVLGIVFVFIPNAFRGLSGMRASKKTELKWWRKQ